MSTMQNHLGQWLVSLRHYLYMCLLMSSPERLPCSPQAITYNIFAYLLIGLVAVSEEYNYARFCAGLALQLIMLGLLTYVTLSWKKLLSRFVQTFSALTGVTLLLDCLTIALVLLPAADTASSDGLSIQLIPIVWSLVVMSYIFKRAFEVSHLFAAMISFNYFALYLFASFSLLR